MDTSQILIVVGINLLITFLIPGIDKRGHLGGLATGTLVGAVLTYVQPRKAVLQAVLVALVLSGSPPRWSGPPR